MDNLLQGLGVFACVGAVILGAIVFFAFRALTRNRPSNTSVDQDDPAVFQQPGTERPRYDTREVESRGGFGGVPQTGATTDRDVQRSVDRELDRGVDFDGPIDRGDILPPLDDDPDREPPRRRDRDGDDDVRSSGGFGG